MEWFKYKDKYINQTYLKYKRNEINPKKIFKIKLINYFNNIMLSDKKSIQPIELESLILQVNFVGISMV